MRPYGRAFLRNLAGALALGVLGLGGGCGDPVSVATAITISPGSAVLEDAGETVQLTASVMDQNGEVMTGVPVFWTSGDSIVALVSMRGLVTGWGAGTTTVQASAGSLVDSATINVELGPRAVRAVLEAVYTEMGGDDWKYNTNWLTDEPLDTWAGIYTDTQGNVIWLQLLYNGLTGTIPPEVGTLHTLEFVSFSENQVTGSIPPELGRLRNLHTLGLGDNRLTGSIPPELGDLRNLRWLRLADNELNGPLPSDLIGLPLNYFRWDDTDLCAPTDDAFQEWLASIEDHSGNRDC